MVPKGEIVTHNDSKTSWYLNANPMIRVSCQLSDLKKLPSSIVPYLIAITDPEIRYNLFVNNQTALSRLIKIRIGDKVMVFIEDCGSRMAVKGKIKYVGSLPEMKGFYFGVELLVSTLTTYLILHM